MAFDIGSVVAHIKADMTGFKTGIESAKGVVASFKSKINELDESLSTVRNTAMAVGAVALGGLTLFLKDANEEANNFQKAMTTLEIIAGRFGVSADEAKTSAKELGTELRIGTGAAAESLQNLLKSGLNLSQARELMKRFANEAMTGKSSTISLAQAVQNLSFAYTTNNSALGNLSGISENFSDITNKGRDALLAQGIAASQITDDMAKFQGIMDLTNLTMGSAEQFAGSYADKQALLDQKILELKVNIGEKLNPVLGQLTDQFAWFIGENGDAIIAMFESFIVTLTSLATFISENKETIIPFLEALVVSFTALTIISVVISLINALLNPITWLAIAIAGFYLIWQTNMFGIQEITNSVINFIVNLWNNVLKPGLMMFWNWAKNELIPGLIGLWNNILKPAFQLFSEWFMTQWGVIKAYVLLIWNGIKTGIEIAWNIISGLITAALRIFQGDWQGAWDAVKGIVTNSWESIKRGMNEGLEAVKSLGNSIYDALVWPFTKAQETITKSMEWIKSQIDFTERHSPSVVDIVNNGVAKVNHALEGLEFGNGQPVHAATTMAAASVPSSGGGMQNNSIMVSLDGAIISDEQGAERMGEIVGDSIIRRLQSNIRI